MYGYPVHVIYRDFRFVTKTRAMIQRVYNFNEHSVWHSILNGDVKNAFVSENMLALSTFGIYHWQKGTDYASV